MPGIRAGGSRLRAAFQRGRLICSCHLRRTGATCSRERALTGGRNCQGRHPHSPGRVHPAPHLPRPQDRRPATPVLQRTGKFRLGMRRPECSPPCHSQWGLGEPPSLSGPPFPHLSDERAGPTDLSGPPTSSRDSTFQRGVCRSKDPFGIPTGFEGNSVEGELSPVGGRFGLNMEGRERSMWLTHRTVPGQHLPPRDLERPN